VTSEKRTSWRVYGVVLTLASLFLLGTMLLPRWQERRRHEQIEAVTQRARKVSGLSLQEAITQYAAERPLLLVAYTGETRSYLEPCGCYAGQAGGIARRATAIEDLRALDLPFLLVDTGNVLDGDTPLERLRGETYLHGMAQIGYDAVLVTSAELRLGLEFLQRMQRETRLPLIASNLLTPSGDFPFAPYSIHQAGVAILGLSDDLPSSADLKRIEPQQALSRWLPIAEKEAHVILVLSGLNAEENQKLAKMFPQLTAILSSRSAEAVSETSGGTPVVPAASIHGKRLGILRWKEGPIDSKTYPPLHPSGEGRTIDTIVLSDEIEDDPAIRQRLAAFYERVASDSTLQQAAKTIFADQPLEQDPKNSYVGSQACQTCHTNEYKQWQTTMHATAFYTLLQVQRHFYPDCVSCHSTGFGYPSGYAIAQPEREPLQGVGCETCHGPGKLHVANPIRENTRREVPAQMCAQCHNEEHHPGFWEVAALLRPEVDHSRESLDLRQMLAKKVKGTTKPEVELFVMSMCPPGTAAEKQLIPILREFGDAVQFRLRFIVEEEGETFKSLHGQAEVEENIRQLVIEKYDPQRLFDYLLCRTKDYERSWEPCAKSLGLDVERIEAIAQSVEGTELLRQNIQRANTLEIAGSPTLLIDGQQFSSTIFTQRIQTRCSP